MKRAAKRITLYFWLAIAAVQLLFAARLAPAKSAFVPENRTWQIFPLAAQAHQLNPSQVSEPQRQRPPPPLKTALGELLGPESETLTQTEFDFIKGDLSGKLSNWNATQATDTPIKSRFRTISIAASLFQWDLQKQSINREEDQEIHFVVAFQRLDMGM
ncbi:MAG: hypothetical protein JO151_18650 [Verrucomicrobia bacterium]|nr:hypothetical protein [Verrucomicrobiota bacterium]